MIWLIPSVAMKLLTRSLTTTNPAITPAMAQATRAMNIASTGDTEFFAKEFTITNAIDMDRPMARS